MTKIFCSHFSRKTTEEKFRADLSTFSYRKHQQKKKKEINFAIFASFVVSDPRIFFPMVS
jgi:hypothetical protein